MLLLNIWMLPLFSNWLIGVPIRKTYKGENKIQTYFKNVVDLQVTSISRVSSFSRFYLIPEQVSDIAAHNM